jgi:RNA polymerase sigma factor (sigma-70 family)
MEPKTYEEQVQQMFDSFCRKILKYKARDYYTKQRKRSEREVSFSGLSEQDLAKLSVTDVCFQDAFNFRVLDHEISVTDETLAEALTALSADRREIILLSYFLDMTDAAIADKLNLVRRTVAHRRASSLHELKKIMEGNANE